jgi:GT2 family glycosyltransferase
MATTVSAVVVSFSDAAATRRAIESLLGQTRPPIEVLLVDNHPKGHTAAAFPAWRFDDRVRLLHSRENIGYTRACNLAAVQARGDWLFFLNPDARAETDCLEALLAAADTRTGLVGAQILLPDGRTNAGSNPLHISGLAWAGRFGEPVERGRPRRVAAVSGAGALARTQAYRALGGLCEPFFMYYDDTDLCWRMCLAGWDVVFCPAATVWHDYTFDKGPAKWCWLERNRLWAVLSNYSLDALLLFSPLLVGGELVVAARALRGGWLSGLVRAWASIARQRGALRGWRRQVQSTRRVSDAHLIELMTGTFDTPLFRSGLVIRLNGLVELYRRIVLAILRTAEARRCRSSGGASALTSHRGRR